MAGVRQRMRAIGGGITFVVVAVVVGLVVNALWGPIYGYFGWRAIAIAVLLLGIMAIAALEEFLRPPNPYKHLDPRFGLQDAHPTGSIQSTSSSVLWNAVPAVLAIALLALSLALG